MDNVRVTSNSTILDEDAGTDALQLSLAVDHGDLTLNSATGLTLVDGDGSDGTLVVSGSLSALNAALDSGITYAPDADYNGSDSLTVTVDDQGYSGAGGSLSDTESIAITVNAVNDAPTIAFTAPDLVKNGSFESMSLAEGHPYLTLGGGSPFLTDWTIGGNSVDLVRSYWVASAGVQSLDMSGNGPGSVQQTLDTIPGVEYTVTFDFSGTPGWGPSDLQVSAANDTATYSFLAANSLGNMLWREETFTFTATSTSTMLTFTSLEASSAGPALDNVRVTSSDSFAFTTEEDTAIVLTGLSVADRDGGANAVLNLSVSHGGLGLASHPGVVVVGDDGSDGTLVVTGTLSDINAALGTNLTYTPDADYNGSDSLSVTINDQGNGGGAALSATESIAIDVDAVTDTFAIATVTTLLNGSFETPLVPAGWFSTYGNGANIGGWTVTGDTIDVVGTLWAASDGIQSVDMNGNAPGGVQQPVATIEDATYRVSFELWSAGTIQVSAGDESATYTTLSGAPWTQHTFDFTADGASTTLAFDSISPAAGPSGAVLDNVEIVRVLENFSLGAGGDVLDLSALLDSVGAPEGSAAFADGWLQFDSSSGTDTVVLFDAADGGDEYVPILTLVGTVMTQDDTDHYLL